MTQSIEIKRILNNHFPSLIHVALFSIYIFQLLDLSYNRIREITRNSFAIYTDIKFLYLQDNMIDYIEDNSFAHLTSLEVNGPFGLEFGV